MRKGVSCDAPYGSTFEKQQLARISERLICEESIPLCSKFLILSGCTNSGAEASTFYSVAPDIYSLITAVFFSFLTKMSAYTHQAESEVHRSLELWVHGMKRTV